MYSASFSGYKIPFTQAQAERFQKAFERNPYPSKDQLKLIADDLNLAVPKVINRFRNQRGNLVKAGLRPQKRPQNMSNKENVQDLTLSGETPIFRVDMVEAGPSSMRQVETFVDVSDTELDSEDDVSEDSTGDYDMHAISTLASFLAREREAAYALLLLATSC
ncbi:hypothetical protein A0H81_01233 [Grifola frondosa]|uniref:Homeobox domain-containing protein n=1 Tax=Grifola frondosa TaxID=5627 RepID=A0A1C7MSS3_GRIFR|nr:hypothetical protein A0H81_01233 [Grifola frondosa]